MTPVLVDSNVILDVVTGDPQWGTKSKRALEKEADRSVLVINPLIYAEVSVDFHNIEDLDQAVPHQIFLRKALPYAAAYLAGKAFRNYRRRGGLRMAPMPDFYIGAHAALEGYRILTRDPRRFRTYFPTVELIAP
jgi:predicted nucleic acid-binding protein